MESKDSLKEILENINQVNAPIDLEQIILRKIQQEENSKILYRSQLSAEADDQIARYQAKGRKAFIVSVVLIFVLGILFSFPGSVGSVELSMITYTSIILILLVFFVQIETGGAGIFSKDTSRG